MAAAGSADGVTAFCRRGELELKGKLEAVEMLINDPDFGSSSGTSDEVVRRADNFLTKAGRYVAENKAQCAGVAVGVGIAGVGIGFQAKEWSSQFANLANVTAAADRVAAVNAVRADALSKLNSGVPLSEVKADLVDNGNLKASFLAGASDQEVKDYLGGKGKNSSTLQGKHDAKKEAHNATTAGDVFAAIGAFVQMAISVALLGATIKQTYDLFCTDGKMDKWRARLAELVAEKERLQGRLKDFLPRFSELLGNGQGDDDTLDGNYLVWVEITILHNQVLKLQAGFNDLRMEVVEEKGHAATLQWSTGTAAVSGAVSTTSAWVSVAAKGNPWLVAAAVMQTVGTVAAGTGCIISTIVKNQLENFEKEIVKHIGEVSTLVEQYGKLSQVTETHYQRYRECKKEVISARDQALKTAKDREARMMSIMEDLKKGPTPEVLARLAALQAEMAATGGA